jgi:hypothetical protein
MALRRPGLTGQSPRQEPARIALHASAASAAAAGDPRSPPPPSHTAPDPTCACTVRACREEYSGQLEFDLGNLAAFDPAPLDEAAYAEPSGREEQCQELATAITQALVNQLFALPSEGVQGGRLAHLPDPSTRLPRQKPIPKTKPLTKWQKFAQEKGGGAAPARAPPTACGGRSARGHVPSLSSVAWLGCMPRSMSPQRCCPRPAGPLRAPPPPPTPRLLAHAAGITKRKRSKLVFDEDSGDWKRRYGYKRANDDDNVPIVEARAYDVVSSAARAAPQQRPPSWAAAAAAAHAVGVGTEACTMQPARAMPADHDPAPPCCPCCAGRWGRTPGPTSGQRSASESRRTRRSRCAAGL